MACTLHDVESAVRAARGADTCAPEDLPARSPGNPARGQCGVTALVLHDLFGGELMRGDVLVGRADFHWWNRLPGGKPIWPESSSQRTRSSVPAW